METKEIEKLAKDLNTKIYKFFQQLEVNQHVDIEFFHRVRTILTNTQINLNALEIRNSMYIRFKYHNKDRTYVVRREKEDSSLPLTWKEITEFGVSGPWASTPEGQQYAIKEANRKNSPPPKTSEEHKIAYYDPYVWQVWNYSFNTNTWTKIE